MADVRKLALQKVIETTQAFQEILTQPLPEGRWGEAIGWLRKNTRSINPGDLVGFEKVISAILDQDITLQGNYLPATAIVPIANPNSNTYKLEKVVIVDEGKRYAFGPNGCSGNDLPRADVKFVRTATRGEIEEFFEEAKDDVIVKIATMGIKLRKCTRRNSPEEDDDEDDN